MKYIDSSKVTEWHSWITILEGDYIDIGLDPVKKEKIQYLEINYLKKKKKGQLSKDKVINYFTVYILFLDSNNIQYEQTENDTIIVPINSSHG